MKTYFALIFSAVFCATSFAQDDALRHGTSHIYLYSGTALMDVTLWRIDSVQVEYVSKGNLAEVRTGDVERIEAPDFLIHFDDQGKMITMEYDLIILMSGDTIRGSIGEVNDRTISVAAVGERRTEAIKRYQVHHFIQKQAPQEIPAAIAQPSDSSRWEEPGDSPAIDDADSKEVDSTSADPGHTATALEKGIVPDQYYHESYQRGVDDAVRDFSKYYPGWGSGGFLLGMTAGSPFLSLAAVTSRVRSGDVPPGTDAKLYRDGYENKIMKMRAKRAAAGAALAKVGIALLFIASF